MTAISLNQILLLYVWFPLAAVIAIMLLVARFYQNFSGDRTYYRWYLVPLVLSAAGAVRYASVKQIAGDWLGDSLVGIGGLVLISLSVLLYHRMTAGRGERGQP